LVTLTGAGGIGKTRLALELGHQSRDHYSGGTVYVQLSAVRSEVLVIPSMATALGVTVERGQSALDAIVDSVQQPVLLIADNLEQIEQVGPQIAQLLSATPMITVLATSRTALRIRGEHEYQVPVLDVGSAVAADVLALAPPPAVQMFVERARASRPGFELTADNASAVAEICRRLDGLPLAIELAAARVRLLSPDALLARLGNRLDTLGSGPADLPERQRTLRATIDWSFSLLDAAAADLMSALAVFNDGWTLEAAAAVCELDELDALVALEALDRQSLILVGDESGEPRFGMLTTVREYAQERLLARPDADDIAARHAAYFLQLLEQAGVGLLGRAQDEWRSRLAQDQGNLRAVLRSLLDRGDVEQACHFIRSIWPFWWLNDQLFEASAWISRAMEQLDGTGTMAQAELLWSAWATALNQGETTHVVDLMHRTLAAANAVDDPFLVAVSILLKSYTLPITGDLDAALDASTQAQRLFSAAGENFMAGLALSGLGTISQMRGDVAAARQYHEQAVTLGRALSNVRLLGQALSSLGMTMVSEGDLDEARRVIDEGAELFLAAGSGDGLNMALSAYALLAAKEGDLRRAAVARGAVEQIRGRIGISVWPVVAGVEAAFVRSVREALGDAEYEDALAEGAGLSRAEAVAAARGIPVSNVRKVDQ
jgi:predicted ATPase